MTEHEPFGPERPGEDPPAGDPERPDPSDQPEAEQPEAQQPEAEGPEAPVPMGATPAPAVRAGPGETVYLGEFNEFKAQLLLEMLKDRGIFAFAKSPPGVASGFTYEPIHLGRTTIVFVEVSRAADARAILQRDLPKRLSRIARQMERLGDDMTIEEIEASLAAGVLPAGREDADEDGFDDEEEDEAPAPEPVGAERMEWSPVRVAAVGAGIGIATGIAVHPALGVAIAIGAAFAAAIRTKE